MKINRIRVFQVDLPVNEGSYNWSDGHSVSVFDSTVVAVDTDEGVTGWGEVCPLGSTYLASYPAGARTGIRELAPALIGLDPRELTPLNLRMDGVMKGHPYVKAAIDVACWDILGKACNQPLVTLLGGRCGKHVSLYRAISQESPEAMAEKITTYRSEGYTKFQLKVGGDPLDDIDRIRAVAEVLGRDDILIADANTGWTTHEALRVIDATLGLDVYVEQPCRTYEECLTVRRKSGRPFVLDEVIEDTGMVVRGFGDGAMDVVNLKISKVGGLTKARQTRDLCVSLGLPMIVEDTWGGDIVTTAICHLAHSTPPEFLIAATDFNSYVGKDIARGAAKRREGAMQAPLEPGLGVDPIVEALGEPVFEVE